MKFLQIDLLAYGHFTNRVLKFPSEGPNFHIIYGRNEAGKSTVLRAITGVLYDIGSSASLSMHCFRATCLAAICRRSC